MRESKRDASIEQTASRLKRAASRWDLHVGSPLQGGFQSQVFACTDAQGTPLVLKLRSSDPRTANESDALRLWEGRGAVRLIDHDPTVGALLMERIVPGTPLPPGNEREAIAAAAQVLAHLHAARLPASHPFPALIEYVDEYLKWARAEAAPGTVGIELLEDSRPLAQHLCTTAGETVLLHGDFLDKNLLLGPAGYVAIDPMPSIGDPGADIGFFAAGRQPAGEISTRTRALAMSLGWDPDRAEQWALIWAIGEACETWRGDSDELQAWVKQHAEGVVMRNR